MAITHGGGGAQQCRGQCEVGPGHLFELPAALRVFLQPGRRGARLRPDRGPARQEQRQQPNTGKIQSLGEIVVPDRVGVQGQLAPPEIHEEKSKVVQGVDAGNLVVEFDGVEERRAAFQEHDVPEMKVAMTLADEPQLPAAIELRGVTIEGSLGVVCEPGCDRRIEHSPTLFHEPCGIAVNDPVHPGFAAVIGPPLRSEVKLRDRGGKRVHQLDTQGMTLGEPVEQPLLIEPVHLDHPLDRRARTAKGERAI